MKKLFLFCFAVGLSLLASAQKVYFLYLQTDDQTPFYVRMADKIHSSSTAGYLILPNLTDSTYTLGVGFPRSTQPEIRFAVTVNQNDKGYLLKNFSDGLSLFDVQALSIVKPISAATDNTVYETKTDKFSAILSKAADDPGLLKVPVPKKEDPKPVEVQKETVAVAEEKPEPKPSAEQPNDTLQRKPLEASNAAEERKSEPVPDVPQPDNRVDATQANPKETETIVQNTVQESIPKSLSIVRRSESSTTEGFGIVYLDRMIDRIDTVRILIPPSKYNVEQESQTTTSEPNPKQELSPVGNASPRREDALGETVAKVKEDQPVVETKAADAGLSPTATCKEIATDKDFMKLRKNMAAKSSDDEMIAEAKKAFKSKCFAAEQLRYLSTLFLTAGAKYQFFDASYTRVLDKENFAALQSEIKDEYYLKRFKALIGE